jgi:hypothetical protein
MHIHRLIGSGELETNGKTGWAWPIEPASILAYCERTGVTWNENL